MPLTTEIIKDMIRHYLKYLNGFSEMMKKKPLSDVFNAFVGREVEMIERICGGLGFDRAYPHTCLQEKDKNSGPLKELRGLAKKHKIKLRVNFPKSPLQGGVEADRFNVFIHKAKDGKYRICSFYMG